jgi:iron complex outermembrane receptor protein
MCDSRDHSSSRGGSSRRRRRALALAGTLGTAASLLGAASGFAQNAQTAQTTPAPSAAASTDVLQEVIVTAQFRNENVQQTPLAITAVSAADLASRGQTSILSLTQDVPSVSLSSQVGAFGPSIAAFIRGIGQSDLDPALEPGVGIYIDDVYFGTLTGSVLDLLDLDRVEVLRGPQGTLEGMNSEGGSVKLFSKRPDATESTTFDLLAGSRNHVELRASTNFAITDDLFVRISGVGNHQDGYVTRYDFGCSNPTFTATDINGVTGTYSVLPGFLAQTTNCKLGELGGVGYAGGRIAVRYVPSDNLEFNLIGDLTNTNQEAPAETLAYAGPGPLALPVPNSSLAAAYSPALAVVTTNGHLLPYDELKVPQLIPGNFYASYASFCLPAVANPIPFTIPGLGNNQNNPPFCVDPHQTIENWGVSLTTDWKLNDDLSVKNILADRGYTATWVHDNSESIWPMDLGAESMEHHQFSEELRISGDWNKFVDYTLGGYYFRELTVYFGHEDLWYAIPTLPGILNFYQNDPVEAHDKAGFLNTEFHLTSKLDAIFGARYTAQDKTYNYVRLNPEGGLGGSATLVSPLNGVSSFYEATRWDWRANLAYHITDQIMAYGQYSTGFKGGGVDPRPFYVAQAIEFQPETLSTFEVGLKTSWFENHVFANVDAYFSQYRNVQLTLTDCSNIPSIAAASAAAGINFGSPCALPFNAGAAHQKGIEFENKVRFGGFQADAQLSWLEFNFVSVDPATGITLSDVPPWTPKWSGGGGVQYTVPVTDAGSVTARLDGATRSMVYTAAVNDPYNRIGGYTTYNAHLTWQSAKSNWSAVIQVLNLTGKKYYMNVFDLVTAGQGTEGANPGPPLEIDFQIKHTM